MKVFVSSTCFDLIDMRAEVADFLRSCGIAPILSDDKLSDFRIKPDKNSIETCLVNVDACDEMIVILDKRYGPRLGDYGYEDVSATNLEYRRFLPTKKQIHFFVRDRLEGDFGIWKKNGKRADLDLTWVGKKDLGLFDFLEERRTLTADKDKPNWFTTFANSSDLKAGLTKYYDDAFLPQRLAEAIYHNEFPRFAVTIKGDDVCSDVHIHLTNVGTTAALNVAAFFEGITSTARRIIAPNQSTHKTLPPINVNTLRNGNEKTTALFIEYDTMLGVAVHEEYSIRVYLGAANVLSVEPELKNQRFLRGTKPTYPISEK